MRVFLAVFIIGVLPAQAQAQAQCEEPYTAQNMVVDMQSAQMALSIDNPEGFTDAGVHLERGLPCLKEKVAPRGLAAAYRIISLTAFRKGDEPRSRRWARTARELDPDFGWGMVELEGSDPYRGVFESERENGGASAVPVAAPCGSTHRATRSLDPIPTALHWISGGLVAQASSTLSTFHAQPRRSCQSPRAVQSRPLHHPHRAACSCRSP